MATPDSYLDELHEPDLVDEQRDGMADEHEQEKLDEYTFGADEWAWSPPARVSVPVTGRMIRNRAGIDPKVGPGQLATRSITHWRGVAILCAVDELRAEGWNVVRLHSFTAHHTHEHVEAQQTPFATVVLDVTEVTL